MDSNKIKISGLLCRVLNSLSKTFNPHEIMYPCKLLYTIIF